MIDPIQTPDVWPPTVEYRRGEPSRLAHLAALREVLADEHESETLATRAIIWVGGGKYWPGIVAGVRLLREMGCTLPVQVWHRGSCEPVEASQVAGLGVEVINLDAMSEATGDNRIPRGDVYRGGWEAKLYALTHTVYEQVLFLDADAYAVRDPAQLFDLLSPAEPFVFWTDLPGLENNIKWSRVLPEAEGVSVPAVQGGQLLIDRRHAAKLLTVAHWICQHSDYYFAWMYGDQDAWRVALAAGACGYRSLGYAQWRDVAFVCGHNRHEWIVHRCQSKLFAESVPNPSPGLPKESRIFKHFHDAIAPALVTVSE